MTEVTHRSSGKIQKFMIITMKLKSKVNFSLLSSQNAIHGDNAGLF